MRHLVFSVRYSVVLINCLLFTVTLYSSEQYSYMTANNILFMTLQTRSTIHRTEIRDVSVVFPLRLTTDFTTTDTSQPLRSSSGVTAR